MDWAQEIVRSIWHEQEDDDLAREELATALRKAKASGMREAANKLDDAPADSNFGLIANLIDELRRSASEIENPTP